MTTPRPQPPTTAQLDSSLRAEVQSQLHRELRTPNADPTSSDKKPLFPSSVSARSSILGLLHPVIANMDKTGGGNGEFGVWSEKEIKQLIATLYSLKPSALSAQGAPDIDINKFVVAGGFNALKTAQNTWAKLKKKLMEQKPGGLDGVGEREGAEEEKEMETSKKKKTTKKSVGGGKKKKIKKEAGDEDEEPEEKLEVEEEEEEEKAKKKKKKKGGSKKRIQKEVDEEEEGEGMELEDEEQQPKKKKAKKSAESKKKAKAVEDESQAGVNGDEQDEDA